MLLSIIVAYRNPTPNAGSPLRKLRIWCFYIGNAFCAWAKICVLKFIVETADINFCLSQEFVTARDLYSSLWNQTKAPRYRSLSQWYVVQDPFQCENHEGQGAAKVLALQLLVSGGCEVGEQVLSLPPHLICQDTSMGSLSRSHRTPERLIAS